MEPPLKISGEAADRYNHHSGNDDYRQPGDLFRLMSKEARERLFSNYADAMAGVPAEIIKRQVVHCYKADPAYGKGLAARMGLADVELLPAVAA